MHLERPDVPIGQWVLTLPLRLRYRLAWVLGARSAWRRAVVPGRGAGEATAAATEPPLDAAPTPRRRQWADLMRRSFGFDVQACDRCGGRLRLIVLIHQADVIGRILTHLGAPTDLPTPQPARSPPHAPVFADN